MLSLKLLGLLGLFPIIFCGKRLLIDQLRWEFLEMENEIWNFSANGMLYKPQVEAELYLAKRFYNFDQKLKQIPENILRGLEPLRTIPNFLYLYSELRIIQTKYEKFREYQIAYIEKLKNTVIIEDLIYDILNNKTGLNQSMAYVYDLTYDGESNIVQEIYKIINENFWCKNLQQSPQQLFYNLYNVISLYELKAYIMQQFAYLGNTLWEKGKTYDEFTRLLQGHIQNEVDMSPKETCKGKCSEYLYTKSYGCFDKESEFCKKVEKCDGAVIACRYVEARATICLSNIPSRRYDYVEYESGQILGKQSYCSKKKIVNSWKRWFVDCSYCMCLCDQHGDKSDRYINLRPVMADIKNNRVVTGLRLIKHNRILHIQIQEGKLLPYGYIDESTVQWVPVDNYTITTPGVKSGKDFFTLSYQHRSMALDEIQINEDNYVVTGVRFEAFDNRVHFEIHASLFNWHNGTIQENEGYYIYETSPNRSLESSLYKADVPVYTNKPSKMHYSSTQYYVEFTHTDFNKDAAQTTIPFIDIQEVAQKPPVPLMGAGIYYKGSDGYGGFIAPLIRTYDYGKHKFRLFPEMGDRTV